MKFMVVYTAKSVRIQTLSYYLRAIDHPSHPSCHLAQTYLMLKFFLLEFVILLTGEGVDQFFYSITTV
ncbi:hypothetical protein BVRB_2g031620 [Beta vulgaris subsp. vulgaris]|uniref:Uncharacterized protein n=1 Tax=Beta vulgaris subsp. vulgaris TaxID=3555 RepID=A0A0J8D1U9_BETVV|nr:hypothetical protein BVRB_2g031620 [Beta vulgaris subsp. vulgaris]